MRTALPILTLSALLTAHTPPAIAAPPRGKSALPRSTQRLKGPIQPDGSWPLDIDTHAERRVLLIHAQHPSATHLMLHGERHIPVHQLADLHLAPTDSEQDKFVVKLRSGRVIETSYVPYLVGPHGDPVEVTAFEYRGTATPEAQIGSWQIAQLKKLMPNVNFLTGTKYDDSAHPYSARHSGFDLMPLSEILSLQGVLWEAGDYGFELRTHSGATHSMRTLELADGADFRGKRVQLDASDPRWWPGGDSLPEPEFPDRSSATSRLQSRLKKLLPTADRVFYENESRESVALPLALVKPETFAPSAHGWATHLSDRRYTPSLELADARGRRVTIPYRYGWAEAVAPR